MELQSFAQFFEFSRIFDDFFIFQIFSNQSNHRKMRRGEFILLCNGQSDKVQSSLIKGRWKSVAVDRVSER